MGADSPKEECGLFGVWAPGEEVAKLTFFGLYALQHRGQESAGIAVSDGNGIIVYKDMGLVAQVFSEATLATLSGPLAIGHTRYSTTGSTRWENAQPTFKPTGSGGGLALGHNGNLTNTRALAAKVTRKTNGPKASTDSDIVAELLAERTGEMPLEDALMSLMPELAGAFSFVVMDERTVYGVRDSYGIRPLSIGRLANGGWVLASETCALDIVGAAYVRDVEPGEIVAVDDRGLRSWIYAKPTPKLCIFEYVYLARPDSLLYEHGVHEVRREFGRRLADEAPVEADLVIGVPDTGPVAAAGFAEATGIPYGDGIVKNRYVGRTFIQPTQTIRQMGIRLKLNPLRSAIKGKRIVVVDDSIVRGNTTRQLVALLREAGATEVHLRITSPPVRWPCFYGIDMATKAELIASDLAVDEIRAYVGADSLAYLSLEGLVAATGNDKNRFCRACFDGIYPVPIPQADDESHKFVLEEPSPQQ
ncbi:MAG TPA: amidophosphoribosyltransferase [Actinomycetota bacterium]|nr:amidophosphoribosyltransferase [Actinomycetota bacterium]